MSFFLRCLRTQRIYTKKMKNFLNYYIILDSVGRGMFCHYSSYNNSEIYCYRKDRSRNPGPRSDPTNNHFTFRWLKYLDATTFKLWEMLSSKYANNQTDCVFSGLPPPRSIAMSNFLTAYPILWSFIPKLKIISSNVGLNEPKICFRKSNDSCREILSQISNKYLTMLS